MKKEEWLFLICGFASGILFILGFAIACANMFANMIFNKPISPEFWLALPMFIGSFILFEISIRLQGKIENELTKHE